MEGIGGWVEGREALLRGCPVQHHLFLPARLPAPFLGGALPRRRSRSSFSLALQGRQGWGGGLLVSQCCLSANASSHAGPQASVCCHIDARQACTHHAELSFPAEHAAQHSTASGHGCQRCGHSLLRLEVEHERVGLDGIRRVVVNQLLTHKRFAQHLAPRPQPVACRRRSAVACATAGRRPISKGCLVPASVF